MALPGAEVPASVVQHLERGARGEIEETVKPGDPRLARADFIIIGNRLTAVAGARESAEQLGYVVEVLPRTTRGEARDGGTAFLAAAVDAAARLRSGPVCVLAAGETTVRVTGRGGAGGTRSSCWRAAEAALALRSGGRRWRASALTASTVPPTPRGPLPTARRSARGSGRRTGLASRRSPTTTPTTSSRRSATDQWGPTGTNVGDLHVFLCGMTARADPARGCGWRRAADRGLLTSYGL